jgi:uncharacterized protein (TIGR03435 family)
MLELVGNHLWQSTLFAAAAALLCGALRRNQPQVRYWLWLAASIKFLVPFAVLTALFVRAVSEAPMPAAAPSIAVTLEIVNEPFSYVVDAAGNAAPTGLARANLAVPVLAVAWLAGAIAVLTTWYVGWSRVAAVRRSAAALSGGREFDILHRLARTSAAGSIPPILACDAPLEPGVVGIIRPVLLWPRSMSRLLSDQQIEAIFAHELAHIRRRDNLTAAVHQIVQALFWFHPLVWWIGARMLDERERACDQEVIHLGSRPDVYAESILRTCQFFLASPVASVAGVTGSDLKRRIEDIMHNRRGIALSSWRKLLLAATAAAAFGGPVAVGALTAREDQTQTVIQTPAPAAAAPIDPNAPRLEFDAATIKRNPDGEMRVAIRMLPGGSYEATNVTLKSMIQMAFRLQEFQVVGGPSWLDSERYDILAKSPAGASPGDLGLRMQSLLIDRLQLKFRRESREAPIYALVATRDDRRLGPQLRTSMSDCTPAGLARARAGAPPTTGPAPGAGGRQQLPMQMPVMPPLGETRPCTLMRSGGRLSGGGQTMAQLATTLQGSTGRVVVDRTGLTGSYDFDLEFTPDPSLGLRGPGGGLPGQPENPRPVDGDALSIFTAVQEQLGLKLESTRGPVDVLVIESAERPSDN